MTLPKSLIILLASLACTPFVNAGSVQLSFQDDAGNPLSDAVASLIPMLSTATDSGPQRTAAVVDQRDNQFHPHVSVIRSNTLVSFPNSDDIRHHVYSFSPAKRFELRLYHGTTAEPILFDQAGQVVLGCNIHDSMLAYVYVVDTDYFAISDANGLLEISAIPAGEYELQVQHPRYADSISRHLVVTQDGLVEDSFQLSPLQPDPRDAPPANELEALFRR